MPPRFLSKEWVAEVRRQLDASSEFAKKLHGVTASIQSLVSDMPDGGSCMLEQEIEQGRLTKLEVHPGAKAGQGAPMLRVRGTYETFAKLNRGELTLMKAVLGGKVKVEGDVAKAMTHLPAVLKYQEIARSVKTVYQ